uniref:Uncharacterized protein n=1 Tax=Knipowitschia caucasica TaxID=637954 RepID=A0AAV2L535_KNICA
MRTGNCRRRGTASERRSATEQRSTGKKNEAAYTQCRDTRQKDQSAPGTGETEKPRTTGPAGKQRRKETDKYSSAKAKRE